MRSALLYVPSTVRDFEREALASSSESEGYLPDDDWDDCGAHAVKEELQRNWIKHGPGFPIVF